MAQLHFLINQTGYDYDLKLGGSGLAFFGDSGYGSSVEVGKYQGTTFVSDGNGTSRGAQANNIKYFNAGSGIIGTTGSGIGLRAIPNYQSTLNVRFTHTSKVKVQNCQLRIYVTIPAQDPNIADEYGAKHRQGKTRAQNDAENHTKNYPEN